MDDHGDAVNQTHQIKRYVEAQEARSAVAFAYRRGLYNGIFRTALATAALSLGIWLW